MMNGTSTDDASKRCDFCGGELTLQKVRLQIRRCDGCDAIAEFLNDPHADEELKNTHIWSEAAKIREAKPRPMVNRPYEVPVVEFAGMVSCSTARTKAFVRMVCGRGESAISARRKR